MASRKLIRKSVNCNTKEHYTLSMECTCISICIIVKINNDNFPDNLSKPTLFY
jgi:hypothetical protein